MLKVGLILYSVRDMMAQDPLGTVDAVAKLGYKSIEVCNHNALQDSGCGFGIPAPDLKAKLDAYGSRVISAHVEPLLQADLDQVIAYEQILGNRNIVFPMGRFATYDDLMRQIEQFNAIGRRLHQEGMQLLYHNHYHEFRTYQGKAILDIIAENTDPDYVGLELDTFWTMRGGRDPVEVLRHFGKRIKLVHQKDFAWDAMVPINLIGIHPEDREPKESWSLAAFEEAFIPRGPGPHIDRETFQRRHTAAFTEIGQGIMPIQSIIDAASAYTDAQYIILEQDSTRMENQLVSIERSMESFRRFRGISWEG